ncbi:MAG: glycerol-3-phosphate 1-O-acyltransferase PlsY [Planctomycetota bacterium]
MEFAIAAGLAAAYTLGSIPFAYLAVKIVKGVDIRTLGSGNVGATNAGRILGRRAALGIYLLDAGKGAGAIGIAYFLLPTNTLFAVGCGILAILGHCFPVWLRFEGGKGVATTTGVFLALQPAAFLIAGAIWILTAAASRFVSLASIALAIAFPIAIYILNGAEYCKAQWPVMALALLAAIFIIARHIPNLKRVAAGTEPKMFTRK